MITIRYVTIRYASGGWRAEFTELADCFYDAENPVAALEGLLVLREKWQRSPPLDPVDHSGASAQMVARRAIYNAEARDRVKTQMAADDAWARDREAALEPRSEAPSTVPWPPDEAA